MGLGNDFLDRAPKTQAIKDKQQNIIRSSQKDLYSKGSDQQSKRKKLPYEIGRKIYKS